VERKTWDNIEEIVPNEMDLKMIKDAANDSDCQGFMS